MVALSFWWCEGHRWWLCFQLLRVADWKQSKGFCTRPMGVIEPSAHQLTALNGQRARSRTPLWKDPFPPALSFFSQICSKLVIFFSEDHYISLPLTTHLYKCQTRIHLIWTDIAPWKWYWKKEKFSPLRLLPLIWFVGQIVPLICFFLTAWVRGPRNKDPESREALFLSTVRGWFGSTLPLR